MQELPRHNPIMKKVAHKGNPVSTCLFILCLEVSFLHVKANHKIPGGTFLQYTYLYRAYVDHATLLKNKNSIRQLMENLSTFSQYSCLKPNKEKYEIAEIRVLKSVKVAVYCMKCVNLFKDTVIITPVHFSYNKIKQYEKIFLER